ncbi:hypothetical protein GYMLUDRAFT_252793 [Collybiopsis luxurians FD-317 M1]|uniref:Uncharacterized protein n=1 Tax=Collybiopsis luxurians FD-317 M1 TaxID=944289 RepID=A0A0D0BYZ7_9AGAR|nr:hypothetical protein GYMLUDRAFT_252793 [Collybiopsis luxurians FD-317 M1]
MDTKSSRTSKVRVVSIEDQALLRQLDDSRATIEELDCKKRNWTARNHSLRVNLDHSLSCLKEKDEMIQDLKQKLDKLEASYMTKNDALQIEVQSLEQELQAAKQEISDLKTKHQAPTGDRPSFEELRDIIKNVLLAVNNIATNLEGCVESKIVDLEDKITSHLAAEDTQHQELAEKYEKLRTHIRNALGDTED